MIGIIVYLVIAALWYWKVQVEMVDGPATRKDRLMLAAMWPFFAIFFGILFVFLFMIGIVIFSATGIALLKSRRKP